MFTRFKINRFATNRFEMNSAVLSGCLVILLAAPVALAQEAPAAPKSPARNHAVVSPVPTRAETGAASVTKEKEVSGAQEKLSVAGAQQKLLELLRLTPVLTSVIERDPSLLTDQDYVSRNNPQLAAFLAEHPPVTRNLDFYLFQKLNPYEAPLVRHVGSDEAPAAPNEKNGAEMVLIRQQAFDDFVRHIVALLAVASLVIAMCWALRLFVENRRWARVFKLQSEVHGKLIDKFSSTQELAAYMETDAGRRFLEAAPISLEGPSQRIPNAVSRILLPLQVGTVLILLGAGFLYLRHIGPEYDRAMRVIGTLILMPGIGFILSAGLTWLMAARLGLLKTQPQANGYEPGSLTRR